MSKETQEGAECRWVGGEDYQRLLALLNKARSRLQDTEITLYKGLEIVWGHKEGESYQGLAKARNEAELRVESLSAEVERLVAERPSKVDLQAEVQQLQSQVASYKAAAEKHAFEAREVENAKQRLHLQLVERGVEVERLKSENAKLQDAKFLSEQALKANDPQGTYGRFQNEREGRIKAESLVETLSSRILELQKRLDASEHVVEILNCLPPPKDSLKDLHQAAEATLELDPPELPVPPKEEPEQPQNVSEVTEVEDLEEHTSQEARKERHRAMLALAHSKVLPPLKVVGTPLQNLSAELLTKPLADMTPTELATIKERLTAASLITGHGVGGT